MDWCWRQSFLQGIERTFIPFNISIDSDSKVKVIYLETCNTGIMPTYYLEPAPPSYSEHVLFIEGMCKGIVGFVSLINDNCAVINVSPYVLNNSFILERYFYGKKLVSPFIGIALSTR